MVNHLDLIQIAGHYEHKENPYNTQNETPSPRYKASGQPTPILKYNGFSAFCTLHPVNPDIGKYPLKSPFKKKLNPNPDSK